MRNLNVGCGPHLAKGFINIDIYSGESVKPDLVMSATNLRFDPDSFQRIYMGHVLEHLDESDVVTALNEAHRVLQRGGVLVIVGPDYEAATDRGDPEVVAGVVHGGQEWPGDEHRWLCSTERLEEFLDQSRFADYRKISTEEATELGAPVVSHVYWQLAYRCVK